MKKIFTNLFNLIVALVGMAWSVFMFFFNIWADSDTPKASEENDWIAENSYLDWDSQYVNKDNIWNQDNR